MIYYHVWFPVKNFLQITQEGGFPILNKINYNWHWNSKHYSNLSSSFGHTETKPMNYTDSNVHQQCFWAQLEKSEILCTDSALFIPAPLEHFPCLGKTIMVLVPILQRWCLEWFGSNLWEKTFNCYVEINRTGKVMLLEYTHGTLTCRHEHRCFNHIFPMVNRKTIF